MLDHRSTVPLNRNYTEFSTTNDRFSMLPLSTKADGRLRWGMHVTQCVLQTECTKQPRGASLVVKKKRKLATTFVKIHVPVDVGERPEILGTVSASINSAAVWEERWFTRVFTSHGGLYHVQARAQATREKLCDRKDDQIKISNSSFPLNL